MAQLAERSAVDRWVPASILIFCARVAQLVEHWSNKPTVAGSIPVVSIWYFFIRVRKCLSLHLPTGIITYVCIYAKNIYMWESFSTYGSRVVPHLSTRQAQWCLTAEFGRDLVFPPWYDRMTIVWFLRVKFEKRVLHIINKATWHIAFRG